MVAVKLESIRLGFNNAGKDMYYELSSTNADYLQGVKGFLTDININNISLSKKSLNALLKDMKCEAFEGDAGDPSFKKAMFVKSHQTPVKDLALVFQELKDFTNKHNLTLSPKTGKLLIAELGLNYRHPAQEVTSHAPNGEN